MFTCKLKLFYFNNI